MSEKVGIKSDTNLTGMHCAVVAGDRFCAGLAQLERAYYQYGPVATRGQCTWAVANKTVDIQSTHHTITMSYRHSIIKTQRHSNKGTVITAQ